MSQMSQTCPRGQACPRGLSREDRRATLPQEDRRATLPYGPIERIMLPLSATSNNGR